MNFLFSSDINTLKKKLRNCFEELHKLSSSIKHKDLEKTTAELLERIDDPFLFVIVGEVKAGKSSFINALLGGDKEICKVAAFPMTDTIQQIVYGNEEKVENINPYLKKIHQPIDLLKNVAIVDTPGTNTIIDHHQEITERFIPHSDLIVLVFESKNPYRRSAWDFFDFISEEWQKKIVFVLQQKDLMVPAELVQNIEGVKKAANEKGIQDPKIFDVSAKLEIEQNYNNSGFKPLRQYIEKNITGGRAPFLKIENNIVTGSNINKKIHESLSLRDAQHEADIEFRNEIKSTLERQKSKTNKQIDILVAIILFTFDRITSSKEKELSEGLSFGTMLGRLFSTWLGGKQSPKFWLEGLYKNFEQELNIALKDKLQDGVVEIAENIQTMAKLVDAQIKTSKTILQDSDEIFADIAEKRVNVLADLQREFMKFMNNSENFYDKSTIDHSKNMMPNIATGGGIAIVGVILTSVLNGMLFDITGGILTTIGLLFAGVSIGFKKRKIMKAYRSEISKGRTKIESEITDTLKNYTEKIKQNIDLNFHHFDSYLKIESDKLKTLNSLQASVNKQLLEISNKLQNHLK